LEQREKNSGSQNLKLNLGDLPEKIASEEEWPWFEDVDPSERRILILSFLYQDAYYEELKRKQRNWHRDSLSNFGQLNLQIEVRHFTPGFLKPEELIGQISERLDAAELEGVPFHGVLLDGVHNVFLQFPHLEGSEMLWPALFELLRTRGVSLVTTHTYFDVSEDGADMQDLQTSRRRVAPLLHALVQSSDYVIKIHPVASLKHDSSNFALAVREHFAPDKLSTELKNYCHRPPRPARYLIEVSGTLSPTYVEPPADWGWDRDRGTAFQVRREVKLVGSKPSGNQDQSPTSTRSPRGGSEPRRR
jgi:hypothetical protein